MIDPAVTILTGYVNVNYSAVKLFLHCSSPMSTRRDVHTGRRPGRRSQLHARLMWVGQNLVFVILTETSSGLHLWWGEEHAIKFLPPFTSHLFVLPPFRSSFIRPGLLFRPQSWCVVWDVFEWHLDYSISMLCVLECVNGIWTTTFPCYVYLSVVPPARGGVTQVLQLAKSKVNFSHMQQNTVESALCGHVPFDCCLFWV